MHSNPATLNEAHAGMHNRLKQPSRIGSGKLHLIDVQLFRSDTGDVLETILRYKGPSDKFLCVRQSPLRGGCQTLIEVPSALTQADVNGVPAAWYTVKHPSRSKEVLVGTWEYDGFQLSTHSESMSLEEALVVAKSLA